MDKLSSCYAFSICATVGEEPPPAALERLTLQQTQVSDEGLKILGKELKTLRLIKRMNLEFSLNNLSL